MIASHVNLLIPPFPWSVEKDQAALVPSVISITVNVLDKDQGFVWIVILGNVGIVLLETRLI